MTPTDREEAVALAINNMDWSQLDRGIAPSNEEIARAAIAALDIEQIERAAYERAFRDAYEIVDDSASPSEALLLLEEVIQKGQADE